MIVMLFGALFAGAGLYCWYAARKRVSSVDPRQQRLADLLIVSASAFDYRNHELYQAAIKEIVYVMSDERWERAEISWKIEQALLILKREISRESFERVSAVAENIIRATVDSPDFLPWEAQPAFRLVSHSAEASAA